MIKVITIATHSNHHLERLLASAKEFGIDVELLGEGMNYVTHNDKTRILLDYLGDLDEDQIILYTDGYDSVFLSDLDYVEKEYLKMDHPFVMGTEQNFNCDAPFFAKMSYYLKYPKGSKPYRFLNAGGWIGRAGYVNDILKLVEKDGECDQDMLNRYLTTNRDRIKLDYENRIFSCMAGRTGMEERDYIIEEDGKVRNSITKSYPAILHAAGKNFFGMYKVIGKLPYIPEESFNEAEIKQYKKSRFWNVLTAQTIKDNYLFHLLVQSFAVIIGLAIVSALLFIGLPI